MHLTGTRHIWTLALLALLGAACGKGPADDKANSQTQTIATNTNSAKTNAEELGLLINMPFAPADDDVVWKQSADGKKLQAVMLLKPEDAAAVVREAEAIQPPQAIKVSSETWFPAELIAQSLNGEDSLSGTAYAANTFLQPPFNSGRLTRIDNTDYFLLEAEAK